MDLLVRKAYADGLFKAALDVGNIDGMYEEAIEIKALLQENEQLVQIINHPDITEDEKIQVIECIFLSFISKEMIGFLRFLVIKNRMDLLDDILTYFIERIKEQKKIGAATVTTPVELAEKQKAKIKKQLLWTTSYLQMEMDYIVDKSLIGGMIIRIGDRIVDSSIKTKLMDLSRKLSKASKR